MQRDTHDAERKVTHHCTHTQLVEKLRVSECVNRSALGVTEPRALSTASSLSGGQVAPFMPPFS